ncbi:hypothetical protein PPSC2_28525 (plasmid) [Paenibacillus polymyxa SC2]|uniref:Uncharacterized protein n=1 Tax=Paenibacillus polymyxa (strain SC2) TaxID=886882 RepID=E3EL97_PAEPS|nr:hypothetical protein PPSC2_28525 [Paenibacillus polymyxa SC2]
MYFGFDVYYVVDHSNRWILFFDFSDSCFDYSYLLVGYFDVWVRTIYAQAIFILEKLVEN